MLFQLRRQPNCFQDSKTPRLQEPTELEISEENHVSSTMPSRLAPGGDRNCASIGQCIHQATAWPEESLGVLMVSVEVDYFLQIYDVVQWC